MEKSYFKTEEILKIYNVHYLLNSKSNLLQINFFYGTLNFIKNKYLSYLCNIYIGFSLNFHF